MRLIHKLIGLLIVLALALPALAQGASLEVAEHETYGSYLTDAEGMSLYLFLRDSDGVSSCYEQCAQNWPPLLSEGDPTLGDGLDSALVGTTERDDGTTQVTYNDWPLYYFANDANPGDTAGQGLNDVWYLVSAQGEAIEAEEEAEAADAEAEAEEAADEAEAADAEADEAEAEAEEAAEETAEPEASDTEEETEAATGRTEHEAEIIDLDLELEPFAEGFTAPVFLTPLPDGSGQLVVLDQIGVAYLLTAEGERLEEPFLDVRDRMVELREAFDERGLLGIAFHPDYADNGRFYVYYSAPLREGAPQEWDHTAHISEFHVSQDNPGVANPDTERIVLQVDQPQFNHNGGTVIFGPDGYLYIALGDGGSGGDIGVGHPPIGHGQDYTTLLGSILRIDIDRGWPGYAIPQDNPLVGQEGRDEIFAWGMRNPYRMSFDAETGDLYAADVGQWLWEEVNLVNEPGNYGWNIKEGTHCFDPQNMAEVPPDCPDTGAHGEPLIDPVIEYPNTGPREGVTIHGDLEVGTTVIGGYVYRGSAFPDLVGKYVYGDWTANRNEAAGVIFIAEPSDGEGLWSWQQVHRFDGSYVLGFGQDEEHELYVAVIDSRGPSGESGRIYKLVPGSQ